MCRSACEMAPHIVVLDDAHPENVALLAAALPAAPPAFELSSGHGSLIMNFLKM